MKSVSITISGLDVEEGSKIIDLVGEVLKGKDKSGKAITSAIDSDDETEEAAPAPAPKKGKKKAKPAPAEDDEEDLDLEESGDDGEDAGDEEDEETEDDEDAPTLQDVIAAFKAYSKKHSKEKAAAILKKFKVKSVNALEAKTYPKVLAALK